MKPLKKPIHPKLKLDPVEKDMRMDMFIRHRLGVLLRMNWESMMLDTIVRQRSEAATKKYEKKV